MTHLRAPVVAGAVGFALGLAVPHARKAAAQTPAIMAGDWVDGLAAEHRMVEALFDKLLATASDEHRKRDGLLMKIAYALNKHGIAEENVIYPELMAAHPDQAAHLFEDHAQIKTFIHRLRLMEAGEPGWLTLAEESRDHVVEHAREEEDEIFPAFREALSDEQNFRLTKMANWEAFKVA